MSTNYYAVEDPTVPHYEGVHLGKRAGGWVFQFKWHVGEHPYRNFDEFKEYVRGRVVKDEYDELWESEEFIDMVEGWCEENDRTPDTSKKSVWVIDGYYFVKGDWC